MFTILPYLLSLPYVSMSSATADGDTHLVTVAASTTAGYAAGMPMTAIQ